MHAMVSERHRRLRTLFDAALDLPSEDRSAFLARECGPDTELLDELTRLLTREAEIAAAQTSSPMAVIERAIEDEAATLDRQQPFGPYRLEEEIGAGGMGRVFRATRADGAFEQSVAIKLMRRELVNPALLKRFSTERAVLAALDDPGIARLIDAGETPDGTPYVVMEHVRGAPLVAYCDAKRLTVRQRVELFRRIVATVAHAHRNLVVHRDLKPGNVLVTDDGVPKLLDFGIAKPLHGESSATLTADRFFTPAYAAPEQLRGGAITVGCDVYALGVLLYELLTGRLPFETANLSAGEIEHLVVSVPPPSMSAVITQGDAQRAHDRGIASLGDLKRQVGGDLDAIVQRALRKEPVERYRTAEQLDADLAAYLDDRPISARPNQLTYRARKFVARHRLAVAGGSFAILALTAAVVLTIVQSIVARQERDRAAFALTFLQDAFVSADPGNAAGGDVRARQILGAARAKLGAIAETQPETFATLSATIAEVEYEIGMPREAAENAARAIEVAHSHGLDDDTLARLLIAHGKASVSLDMTAARRSLEEARKVGAGESIEWQLAYGRMLTRGGESNAARPYIDAALGRTRDAAPTSVLATSARWYDAELRRAAEDYAGALAALDRTLAWQREGLPLDHPRIVETRMRRLDVLRRLGRDEEALSEARKVVDEIDEHFGADSTLASYARNALGGLLLSAGRHEQAADVFRAGADGWEKTVGRRHESALRARFNQALAEMRIPARHASAEVLLRDLVVRASEARGASSQLALYFRIYCGDLLTRRGKGGEALVMLVAPEALSGVPRMSDENREKYRVVLEGARTAAGCGLPTAPQAVQPACEAARRWAQEQASRPEPSGS